VVRDSILWNDVAVGEDARIDGSIIASHVRIGKGATVPAGSVIGHNVTIDAGEILRPGSRVGVQPVAR